MSDASVELSRYIDTLNLLGDESRIRLCALLRERELCVTDLVRVTGIAQSRVSTHLGRLREAGFVRDRRKGPQSFYALATDTLPAAARAVPRRGGGLGRPDARGRSASACASSTPSGAATSPSRLADELERDYSPGRTWQSLAVGHRRAAAARRRARRRLGRRRGGGVARAVLPLAHLHRHERAHDRGRQRAAARQHAHVRAQVADVHELPFAAASFDAVLVFHTLTYAEHPARALAECARVLRPGGRLVLLCLDEHQPARGHRAATASATPASRRAPCAACSSRAGLDVVVCRGRLPRGQEAALAGGAGHRRQAQARDRQSAKAG